SALAASVACAAARRRAELDGRMVAQEVPRPTRRLRNLLRKPRSPAGGTGAVQKARITVPVTRATALLATALLATALLATALLNEVGSCSRALRTRPKPTTSVTQESASITTFRCVRRLAASSEKLFMTRSPKTVPVISRSEPAEGSVSAAAGPLIAATQGALTEEAIENSGGPFSA